MVPGVLDAAKAKKLSLEFMQLSQGGFHPYLFPFDFPFIYIPIRFDSMFNYRHSLISAVSISAIFDLTQFIILSYFLPLDL